jgi:MFS family permease
LTDRFVQGLLQISMPFILYLLNYFPQHRKLTLWLGCFLCFASALGGAFARTVSVANATHSVLRNIILNLEEQPLQLIICLGPLYGIGAGMLFAPTMAYMGEWFDKKKSLAYGIM